MCLHGKGFNTGNRVLTKLLAGREKSLEPVMELQVDRHRPRYGQGFASVSTGSRSAESPGHCPVSVTGRRPS